jgi:hypothetical protein
VIAVPSLFFAIVSLHQGDTIQAAVLALLAVTQMYQRDTGKARFESDAFAYGDFFRWRRVPKDLILSFEVCPRDAIPWWREVMIATL